MTKPGFSACSEFTRLWHASFLKWDILVPILSGQELTLGTGLTFISRLTCPVERHKSEEKVMFTGTLVEQHIHVETVNPSELVHSHSEGLRHQQASSTAYYSRSSKLAYRHCSDYSAANWNCINGVVRAPDADAQPARLRGSRQTGGLHATSCTNSFYRHDRSCPHLQRWHHSSTKCVDGRAQRCTLMCRNVL